MIIHDAIPAPPATAAPARRHRLCLMALAALLAGPAAEAAVLDFETLPGGAAADNLAVGGQHEASHGVTFRWRGSPGGVFEDAALERTGGDRLSGFLNHGARAMDVGAPATDGGLGRYYLRGATGLGGTGQGAMLVIDYSRPTAFASAQLWDIDGSRQRTEQWRVTAFDAAGGILETVDSPLGDSQALDGLPWTWVLGEAGGTAPAIARIEIAFIGSKTANVGFGLDQLETGLGVAALPAAAWLLGPALAGLGLLRRRAPAA